MTHHDNALDDATHSQRPAVTGCYGSFVADGDPLVYDRDDHTRWLQADHAVPVEEMR